MVRSFGPTASMTFSASLCSAGGMSIPIDAGEAVVNARLFWSRASPYAVRDNPPVL